jgi:hypothetical protein
MDQISPHERAVRYRRLALLEPDQQKVRVLHQIAEESERGVLVTSEWMTRRHPSEIV